MKIIAADYIYAPAGFLTRHAIAFEKTIIEVLPLEILQKKYPDADVMAAAPHSVLYPGFINTHVHLEFSSNKTTLEYGSFIPWLYSVIDDRDALTKGCDTHIMQNACREMLRSGITSFGAISSFGLELEACIKTPQRVVFFNEFIGSNPQNIDILYADFQERLKTSCRYEKDRIIPGIAIHAPYSVHPVALKRIIKLAKENHYPLSAHLLESAAERSWLDHGDGEFKPFFETYFNQSRPFTTAKEFIEAFDGYPTHFTHCTQASEKELEHLSKQGHSIAHCPRSNRYLGCGRLALEKLNLPFSLATDGLSSNNTLSLFDELRAALMMHECLELKSLAAKLIQAVTSDAAYILNLDCGNIEPGKSADFTVITLPDAPKRVEEIPLWTILHTKEASQVYIEGEQYV